MCLGPSDSIANLGRGAAARVESARIEKEIADLDKKIAAGETDEGQKTRTRTPVPERTRTAVATPERATAGEAAVESLTNQLNNLDAAARLNLITGKEEQELKARLYEQAIATGSAHGAEVETNAQLLAQLDTVKLHTEGYVGALQEVSTETQKTTTTTLSLIHI